MKKAFLIPLVLILAWAFPSCTEETEPEPCQEIRDDRYPDIEEASFSVNGGDRVHQNYTTYAYRDDPSKASEYTRLWTGVSRTHDQTELIFTRINFDDQCKPFRDHIFLIVWKIAQLPFEEMTYQIGAPFQSTTEAQGYAAYLGGSLLEVGESERYSEAGAGSITITKYITDERLTGYYSLDIGGILVEGEFDYDLKKEY
jgi:hypothetical protein